jgi:hypothetical protein
MSAYTPEHFAAIKAPRKEELGDIQLEDGVDAEEAYRKALSNGLTKKAIKLLNSHGTLGHPSASEADFAVMGYLHRAGLTPSENASVICAHPRGDDIHQRHPDRQSYLKLSLGKIYSNGTEPEGKKAAPLPYTLADVEAAFSKWLQIDDLKGLHVVLAAVAAHRAGGDGVWQFIVDAPGSGKTETIRSLNGLHDVVPLSSLTPSTFASGLKVSDAAKDPSLLLRLPERPIIILKDFTTVLSMNRDSRQEILAQLRELADGSYVKEFGNGKTVSWQGTMCFIAGVTPIIDTHWSVNQTLGERFIQARPTAPDPLMVAERAMLNVGREEEMRRELQGVVSGFLTNLEYPSISQIVLSHEMKRRLASLATFACRARSAVIRSGYGGDISYIPVPEGPARLAKQLNTLARGLAIIEDEAELSETTFDEILSIGMDCIPPPRRLMLETLINARGELVTPELTDATGYPVNSARRILEELMAIDMVDRRLDGNTYSWGLSKNAKRWYRQIALPRMSVRGSGMEK